jgi:hypothetical protein
MDSIKAAELIAQAATALGVAGKIDPSPLANAALGAIADALEALVAPRPEAQRPVAAPAQSRSAVGLRTASGTSGHPERMDGGPKSRGSTLNRGPSTSLRSARDERIGPISDRRTRPAPRGGQAASLGSRLRLRAGAEPSPAITPVKALRAPWTQSSSSADRARPVELVGRLGPSRARGHAPPSPSTGRPATIDDRRAPPRSPDASRSLAGSTPIIRLRAPLGVLSSASPRGPSPWPTFNSAEGSSGRAPSGGRRAGARGAA